MCQIVLTHLVCTSVGGVFTNLQIPSDSGASPPRAACQCATGHCVSPQLVHCIQVPCCALNERPGVNDFVLSFATMHCNNTLAVPSAKGLLSCLAHCIDLRDVSLATAA